MSNEKLDQNKSAAFNLQKEILLSDWAAGKAAIRDFDSATFKIKGWAITVFGATLAASVALMQPNLILFSVLSSVLFWALDALFKSFQHRFILRDEEIGNYLSSPDLISDQANGEISRVMVAKPFYHLNRLVDERPDEITPGLQSLAAMLGVKPHSMADLIIAMRMTNVKALYLSLAVLAVLLWLGFLTFASNV